MKTIILLTVIFLSTIAQAGGIERCKAVGEQAEKVMNSRQNSDDLFKVLEKYTDDEMVISAFERPRYNTVKTLSAMINGLGKRNYNSLTVYHDQVAEKQRNEVSLFKMRYIKVCLSK